MLTRSSVRYINSPYLAADDTSCPAWFTTYTFFILDLYTIHYTRFRQKVNRSVFYFISSTFYFVRAGWQVHLHNARRLGLMLTSLLHITASPRLFYHSFTFAYGDGKGKIKVNIIYFNCLYQEWLDKYYPLFWQICH